MEKLKVKPQIDLSVIEKLRDEEMVLLVGGKSFKEFLQDIFGSNNCDCSSHNEICK